MTSLFENEELEKYLFQFVDFVSVPGVEFIGLLLERLVSLILLFAEDALPLER